VRRGCAKPADVPSLLSRIATEFDALPRQQKAVASYLEQHRASVPVDRAGDIAARSGVQASTVVRFAQRLGYSGYSELQVLFRREYAQRATPMQNYQQRIRRLIASKKGALTSGTVAREFVAGSLSGLTELARDLDEPAFEAAVALLERAQNIYVVGVRRAFPVAAYIAYALQHTNKRVHLVDGIGGMYREQMRAIGGDDVVVAISFTPYGKETLLYAGGRSAQGEGAGHHRQQDVAARAPCARAGRRQGGQRIRVPLADQHFLPVPGAVRRACVPARTQGRGNARPGRIR
jgi:DNA-binding MurR/RpiR family transcriptional regulator